MQYIQNFLLLFTSCYIGVGHHLFQIHSSDFSKFIPPFNNDFYNAVTSPLIILLIPAFILFGIHLLLNKINRKLSEYFISIILSASLVLYIMRAYYLVEGGYILSLSIIILLLAFLFILVLILRRFLLNLFLYFSIISFPLTLYFSYNYFSFLTSGFNNSDSEIKYNIENNEHPIFIFVFDELSSYLILDDRSEINRELFPALKEFSETSTWYPNALTNISSTDIVVPQIASGENLFIACSENEESVGKVIDKVYNGKCGKNDIFKLDGVRERVVDTDFNQIRANADNDNKDFKFRLFDYFRQVFLSYAEGVMNPHWGQYIVGKIAVFISNDELNTFVGSANKKFLEDQYGITNAKDLNIDNPSFINCLSKTKNQTNTFNKLINAVGSDTLTIYPIITEITHSPFCYGSSRPVDVLYPLRKSENKNGETAYLPDCISTYTKAESNCGYDEVTHNVKRSRLNQSIYGMKLFEKSINKIKEKGLFDKSYIFVLSDHGSGFMGPSSGRKNKDSRSEIEKTDNRMINSSIVFFTKYPNQEIGVVDSRVVFPYDVGATLIDILNIEVPWDIDGQSLISDHWNYRHTPFDFVEYVIDSEGSGRNSRRVQINDYPYEYYEKILKRVRRIDNIENYWIGKNISELPLSDEKAGEIEFLKKEEGLPDERKRYFYVLGGHSTDINNKQPALRTYISINDKIIKIIKPCLRFFGRDHRLGNIPGGWVATLPLDEYEGDVVIRAFSTMDEKEDVFYELGNTIKINMSEVKNYTASH